MKSLLVAVSGTSSDSAVIDAAYALATPLKAHLDFVHIPLASIEIADFNRHIEFARGSGLELALRDRLPGSKDAETTARARVTEFCASRGILQISQPISIGQVTASWIACPIGRNDDGFTRAARTHDLTIVGRSAGQRSWSQTLLENLTVASGRPVLIVPSGGSQHELRHIAVWWKDHSAAARAVSAAGPLLRVARKVTVFSILESETERFESAENLARQLGWHGIEATSEILLRNGRPSSDVLWTASLSGKADIVVMGGFSRPRIQEMIFGGCTQAVLEAGARPVFLLH
jgi:nucleotide-binding universal stress UspA family protein